MDKMKGLSNVGNAGGSTDKPYRTVETQSYNFGFDDKAESKTRVIVKEPGVHKVREYDLEDGVNYFCCGCFAKNKSKNYAYFDEHGFLMVPERHDCQLIPVEQSNQNQKRKITLFNERKKLLKADNTGITGSSSASAAVDLSKAFPVVDLTDFSNVDEADSCDDVEILINGVYSPVSLARSNASSPDYVPEESPLNSFPSSPRVTDSSATNITKPASTKTSVPEIHSAMKDAPENRHSSQSFNVTETSSEPSLSSPSGINGKENQAQDSKRLDSSSFSTNAKVQQHIIKADRRELESSVNANKPSEILITLDDTVDDDSNAFLTAENEEFTPIEDDDYQYGYSQNGVPNSRLIVFDLKTNRESVRQYSKISNRKQWYCMGCYRAKRKHNKAYFVGKTFMVPKKHFCQKFTYAQAKEMQREIIQKLRLPGHVEMDSNSTGTVRARSRTEGCVDRRSANVQNSKKTRALSPIICGSVAGKVIKTDRSEFDDGYNDPSTNSSSSVEDYVDPNDDEDYHPSNETDHVPTRDFHYGYSAKKGNHNGRLIVFEPNDRSKVRQYAWNNCNFYFCIECYRLKKKKFGGKIEDSTFMAPRNHFCQPISYGEAMLQQKEIAEKFAIGRPSVPAGNIIESTRISQRLQNKRNSTVDEGNSSDEDAELEPYHSTPSDDRRRLVQAEDFHFGVGNSNQENFKVIVFEENDRNFVRVYGRKTQRQWYCCGCLRLKHSNYGTLNERTFNAPIFHTCQPLTYETVRQIQQRIRERYQKLPPSQATSFGAPSSDGLSLSNVAPVKPGSSSISPPVKQRVLSKTELDKRYDENLRNFVINNPPTRNMPLLTNTLTPAQQFKTSGVSREVNSNRLLPSHDQSKNSSMAVPPSYKEVHPNNWQYGFDSYGNPNKRIIIRDFDNPDYGHEYRNDRNDTRCLGCAKNGKVAAKLIDDVLYAPPFNDHTCEPRVWSEIQRLQKEYSRNMGRKRGRTVFSMESAITKRTKYTPRDENSGEEDEFEDSYMDTNAINQNSSSFDRKPSANTVKNAEPSFSSDAATVSYYNPSSFFLSKCCKELKIQYSNDAYKFWSRINIEKVKLSSRPQTTYETKEPMYHGFSSFSLYFTGNESSTPIIREMINRFVYNNFKSLGNCMGHDFSEFNHETPVIRDTLWSFALTEIHLECLSRWFDCRIGIFEGRKWKRYGNWNDEESATPAFLMEFKDGKYNPIMALA